MHAIRIIMSAFMNEIVASYQLVNTLQFFLKRFIFTLRFLPPVLNDEQLSHRINSSTAVRQYCVVVLYGIRFVVSASYKTETNRRRIARLAWTNNSSKTDLIESSF